MKRITVIAVAFIMAIAFMPVFGLSQSACAGSGKKIQGTSYNYVLKSGSSIYCACEAGLYKVKIVGKTVKEKKCLVTGPVSKMTKKGDYIYFDYDYIPNDDSATESCQLSRINISTQKVEVLFDNEAFIENEYVIYGKKIYYTAYDLDGSPDETADDEDLVDDEYGMRMDLDGSHKETTNARADQTLKKSNTKKYQPKFKNKEGDRLMYLKCPIGKKLIAQWPYED